MLLFFECNSSDFEKLKYLAYHFTRTGVFCLVFS